MVMICPRTTTEEKLADKTFFKLAMPPDVRAWLDRASEAAGRSRTMHIIFLLRQEMDKKKASEPAVGSNSDAQNSDHERNTLG